MRPDPARDQSRVIDFLSSPAAFGQAGPVERIETHGALVFLCGDTALKLKRAVRYDYMDLSTPEKRHALLLRELELNRPAAPSIYRDVMPVTQAGAGPALGGEGPVLDWVLRMHRFPAEDELTSVAARGGLDDAMAGALGLALAAYHAAAPQRPGPGAAPLGAILDELQRVFAEYPEAAARLGTGAWLGAARGALRRLGPLLDRRAAAGHVRRGHGDLHLANLVLIEGRPVPFDALEFDETLGTCDLLYDLGFLLMDLCHRGLDRAACRVLDAWLAAFAGREDGGLAALPLFLSLRAAIRAMVLLQTDAARGRPGASLDEAQGYMAEARGHLAPPPPMLLAVGGLSGSGKSLLARALAPGLGARPGAVLLSSDLARKAGDAGAAPLPRAAYTPTARAAVYDRLLARAAVILAAGHAAILDATFLDPAMRAGARHAAEAAGVPFRGLWLEAPREVLEARVAARRGDASDADLAVLHRQMQGLRPPRDWDRLDASGPPAAVLAAARARLEGAGLPRPA